jgi:hypothetical protein
MSKRRSLLIALPVVLLLLAAGAGTAAWFARPKKAAISVDVSGTPGLPLTGTAEVDGKTQELTGTVPTKFTFEGTRVVFTLASPAEKGEFRARLMLGDNARVPAGSGNPPKKGIRGWAQSGWGWSTQPECWMEPFDREAESAWLKPPPP